MPLPSHDEAGHIVALGGAALLPRCMALGGRPYQQSRHELTNAEYVRLYGHAYDRCISYAARHDPENVFGDWNRLSSAGGSGNRRSSTQHDGCDRVDA
jgi:hypothetical protein